MSTKTSRAYARRQTPSVREILRILLTPQERRNLLWLFLLALIMAVFEVVGVASIMPFMSVVSDPTIVERNEYLRWAYATLGFTSMRAFILFLGGAVLVALVVSNATTALATYAMVRFTWMRNHTLSTRLLTHYMHEPYVFFLDRNTADLSKNILAEVSQVVSGVLLPGVQLFAKGLVAIAIILFLVLVDPRLAALVVIVLGGAYAGLYALVQRKLGELGRERVAANEARFKTASEALGGIKDLKLLGREAVMIDRFARPSQRFAVDQATKDIVGQLPRYGLEILAFGGIVVITLYLVASARDLSQILPIVALYTFAGYRLMPALQQVFAGMASLRFNVAALDLLVRDLRSVPAAPANTGDAQRAPEISPLPVHHEISLRDVTFAYPNSDVPVLRDLSLTIAANTTVGLVGATGSGKTTTADILLGLLEPSAGQLFVDGTPVDAASRRNWQRSLGYVPQQIFLCDDDLRHNIAFGIADDRIDDAAVERAARIANLHDFIVQQLPAGYRTHIGERGVRLSGGQRQRIGIARALYHDPAVLIMDEATSALDGITEDAVMDAIHAMAHRKTIVLIAHRLSTVRTCDVIHMFEHGRLVASGSYEELIEVNMKFRAMAKVAPAATGS